MKTFYLKTLGCRLNQFESRMMAEELAAHHIAPADTPENADLIIVNSCTVTARADNKTLQYVRQMRHKNPAAKIALIGCMPQVAREKLLQMPEIDYILGNDEKNRIAEVILSNQRDQVATLSTPSMLKLAVHASGNERVNLKIQDGCDNTCSYCLVTIARGPSRSIPLRQIHEKATEIAEQFPEIILSGVHIGTYGKDLPGTPTLAELVSLLLEIPTLNRLRLSSIEPTEIDAPLLELLQHPKLCKHLHIPLQSTHNIILERMNRHYTIQQAASVLEKIKQIDPNIKIGSDIITGFPGENDAIFAESFATLQTLPIDMLHVFPFSARPGTVAATLDGHVRHASITERAEILRNHSNKQQLAFDQSQIGTVRQVIFEADTGYLKGETDNYVSVVVPSSKSHKKVAWVKLCVPATQNAPLQGEFVP